MTFPGPTQPDDDAVPFGEAALTTKPTRRPSVGDIAGGPVGDSLLDDLRRELAAEVGPEPLRVEIATRPGYVVTFSTDISGDDFRNARKRAVIKGQRDWDGSPVVDEARMSALLLATHSTGLIRNGEPLLDGDGEPMTLRSRELLDILGAHQVADGIRKLYGTEAELLAHGRALIRASGWNSDATEAGEEGPTSGG